MPDRLIATDEHVDSLSGALETGAICALGRENLGWALQIHC